ncbi:glycosyltransferase [Allostreptomyces psammosilenae]|uniref:D-inositol 3-phosphate glycosyltransferase n=1 Tax=Allostreptomyces psammosilenae TaxID=1892865 RepID=A0A852ZP04_9ACTN|nr:glycosyltransferase [Allostreptomyces psammosilenae]NYI04109.1 glycosyltransferase involved in cell wall biosynthesis [Allostreptomyces psammosilenae]
MRIAMVSEHADPLAALGGADAGGQNVHVASLSTALAARGHEITVYTRRHHPTSPRRVRMGPGVTVEYVVAGPNRPLPKDDLLPYMPEFGRRLAERWAEAPVDLVHAHFWMSGIAALIGTMGAGIPVVQTFHALGTVKRRHQGEADTSPPGRIAWERAIGARCARTIATCGDEVFELMRMGLRREAVSVVPCGVDLERFRPGPDERDADGHGAPAWPPARPGSAAGADPDRAPTTAEDAGTGRWRALAVGRLVPRKGFDTAIRALRGVPSAELLIAGGPPAAGLADDPEARRLIEVAERAGVRERVRLLGSVPRERMPELIRACDAVVCSPVYEPFGIVPLEAMACRRPVVASAVGGLIDTVVDGVTGILVPPGDPEALGQAMARLAEDPELARRYGRAGERRVRARYGWDHVAGQTLAVYQQVVGAARTPRVSRSRMEAT